MSIVSNNIKYLRRLNGLTQEQFARRIGIKRPSVGAYEEARAHPPYDTLISMAKLFGVTIDQLIKSDLRKVRETPDLSITTATATPPPRPPVVENKPEPPRATEDPKPIAAVVDKFYRDDRAQIRLVAQRVMFKRIATRPGPRKVENEAPPVRPSEPLPRFNSNYEGVNGHVGASSAPIAATPSQPIALVRQQQAEEYNRHLRDAEFLEELPRLQLPLQSAELYRAFEAGSDFAFPGASLVGKFVGNWYELEDGRHYVLIVQNRGILYRRVYNQVKIKGTLLVSADDPALPSLEIPIKDVLEAWEVKAFLSYNLPKPSLHVERLRGLVTELQEELNRGA
jgi:transcriptional regulator with XRE-family HTH domain